MVLLSYECFVNILLAKYVFLYVPLLLHEVLYEILGINLYKL